MLFWICLVCIVTALVLYFRQAYSRFSRHGVKHFTPIPPFGHMWRNILGKEHFVFSIMRDYKTFATERFIGRYEFLVPMVMLRDLELIKKVTIKDFEHFVDHRVIADQDNDPFFGRNLIGLKGQEWKDMRSTLSPAFTTSKIRQMVPFMVEVGDQMIESLKLRVQQSENGYVDVDAKDLTTRYTNDVIASCAFGLKVDSQADRDNEFYRMGKDVSFFSFKQIFQMFLYISMPNIMKKLKWNLFCKQTQRFFRELIMNMMKEREARQILRPDMIHLLMEAKKGKLTHDDRVSDHADAGFATVEESSIGKKQVDRVWSDDDIVAQAVLFFIAGFETVSTAVSFMLYELAVNPDVQDKLYQEIIENDVRNGGQFDYNSIQQMTYLDMVVSETLRLWPPGVILDRLCIKDYNIGKPNDEATQDYIIRKGELVQIPVWGFHRDPQLFPDPHKFDPQRFSEENKHNIKPFTFIPFGVGPRNCIGSRFALCEVKVMVYQLLRAIEVSPAKKTRIPAKLAADTFNIRLEGGHWIRFKARI